MGYKFQFITLAGFHALNYSMFNLADNYREAGMSAYVELQEQGVAAEDRGYTATKHQREVGAGYFDNITQVIAGGTSSITALDGSTEEEQFPRRRASGRQRLTFSGENFFEWLYRDPGVDTHNHVGVGVGPGVGVLLGLELRHDQAAGKSRFNPGLRCRWRDAVRPELSGLAL